MFIRASKCAALRTTGESKICLDSHSHQRLPSGSQWEGGRLARIRSNPTRGRERARSFRGAELSRWQGKEFEGEGGKEAATWKWKISAKKMAC